MISIVLTYKDRPEQLRKTLESISKSKERMFEVIIVDDGSDEVYEDNTVYNMPVSYLRLTDKNWKNTCIPYNAGFANALAGEPEVILIQNAECCHEGDIVSHAKNVPIDEYWVYHCYSLAEGETPGLRTNNKGASFDHESAWYCHEVFRPKPYHFCSAMRTENLIKLNGMDERLAYGIAYEDDMFLHQIKSLGLKIKYIHYPFVFHQYHFTPARDPYLIKKNFEIFTELSQFPVYRAEHLISPDL